MDDQRVQAVGLHGSRQQLQIVGLHRSRQHLLEEPPAPKPTGRQAVEAANKQFKEATFKLREAIIQKSDLQSKVDKVKDQYMGLLRQLQEANDTILKAQQQVQAKQTTLQEAVRDDLVEIEDETAEALKKAGWWPPRSKPRPSRELFRRREGHRPWT